MAEIPRWKWDEPPPFEERDYWEDIQRFFGLMEAGKDKQYTWTQLAYQDPPERLPDRILWTVGVALQMILSVLTFPATIAAFLLEESVQSAGMGAYILSSSRYYDLLDAYLPIYKSFIDGAETGAKGLAYMSPICGGAVMVYMSAAQMSHDAFRAMTDRKLIEQMEKDEELRRKLLDDATFGTLRLSSVPSQAEIWIDGKNTELLTPETFKQLEEREYNIELRRLDTKTDEWEIYSFTTQITAGRVKEIRVRIPPTITTDEEEKAKAVTGTISLKSTPTSAEIWIDGVDTGKLTPETLKDIEPGKYKITLRSYSRRLDVWDEYTIAPLLLVGEKLEIKVNIPGKAFDAIHTTPETDEGEKDKLPQFVNAEVKGEYAIDGDTFITTTGERIRILGMDTPEIGQPWADVAQAYLDELIWGKSIRIKIQSHKPLDTHGRTLAICMMYKGDIAELMLSAGYARLMVFEDDVYDPTSYELAEQMAKERRIGIWGEMPP